MGLGAKEAMTHAKMADLYKDLRAKMVEKKVAAPASGDDSVGKAIAREISKALAADPLEPMTPQEIQTEIDAYRADVRRATGS